MSIYSEYEDVKSRIDAFRSSLVQLHRKLSQPYDGRLPVVYVATSGKNQIWFIQCETVSLNTDTSGTYSISILGCGVRAYFAGAVDMTNTVGFPAKLETYANPEHSDYKAHWPSSNADLIQAGLQSLTRYEVFGRLCANVTSQRISITDIIRNNTVGDMNDCLLGQIKNPHFVGNFARTASYILDFDGLGPIPDPEPSNSI